MLTRYWLNRNTSHLWEMGKGPLTPIDQTEEVYLAAEVEGVVKDAKTVLSACVVKLKIYREHSGGKYQGGMEHTALIAEATRLLARLEGE